MINKVTVSIQFCFKGKNHEPSIEFDFNDYVKSADCLPDLYPLLARENGYDLYSYEYEMMQAEDIVFSQAKGLVADFIADGSLDFEAFKSAWLEAEIFSALQLIAKQHCSVNELEQDQSLKKALLEAYHLGKSV